MRITPKSAVFVPSIVKVTRRMSKEICLNDRFRPESPSRLLFRILGNVITGHTDTVGYAAVRARYRAGGTARTRRFFFNLKICFFINHCSSLVHAPIKYRDLRTAYGYVTRARDLSKRYLQSLGARNNYRKQIAYARHSALLVYSQRCDVTVLMRRKQVKFKL